MSTSVSLNYNSQLARLSVNPITVNPPNCIITPVSPFSGRPTHRCTHQLAILHTVILIEHRSTRKPAGAILDQSVFAHRDFIVGERKRLQLSCSCCASKSETCFIAGMRPLGHIKQLLLINPVVLTVRFHTSTSLYVTADIVSDM